MGPLDLLNHLLNFVAPAAFVAAVLALAGRVVVRRSGKGLSVWKTGLIGFAVGVLVLAGGLVWFGRDGKMATYAVLVIACATSQWILGRGWQR